MPVKVDVKVRKKTDLQKKFDRLRRDRMRLAVQTGFEAITTVWPVDTYWSLANHRINVQGENSFLLNPPQRPEMSGALAAFAPAENARELQKLDDLPKVRGNRTVNIGNPVWYAKTAGKGRRGLSIYRNAAAVSAAAVKQAGTK